MSPRRHLALSGLWIGAFLIVTVFILYFKDNFVFFFHLLPVFSHYSVFGPLLFVTPSL